MTEIPNAKRQKMFYNLANYFPDTSTNTSTNNTKNTPPPEDKYQVVPILPHRQNATIENQNKKQKINN